MMPWNCALSRWRTISPCASASPTCPIPICSVPPSGTRPAACSPIAYLVSLIGSAGGANSGKSGAGHERQFGIDLANQLEGGTAFGAGAQNIQRGIGVAAQAVARDAVDHALC